MKFKIGDTSYAIRCQNIKRDTPEDEDFLQCDFVASEQISTPQGKRYICGIHLKNYDRSNHTERIFLSPTITKGRRRWKPPEVLFNSTDEEKATYLEIYHLLLKIQKNKKWETALTSLNEALELHRILDTSSHPLDQENDHQEEQENNQVHSSSVLVRSKRLRS